MVKVLEPAQIPPGGELRRQRLFNALDQLCSSSPPDQAELFRESLRTQIHDDAARMLILKTLAEGNGGTLRIFGRLGIEFFVLSEYGDLAGELARRFSPDN
jgi:hypothetical protein